MRSDDLNHILSGEDEILPSSGFVDSVMDAVRREAEAPPPIPFPWKRALPLLAVACVTLAVVTVVAVAGFVREAGTHQPPATWTAVLPVLTTAKGTIAGWTLLALLVSFASVKLSMRLGRGRV
jgi:hypothetical protein